MEFKKFTSGMEMYEYICNGNDLYSKSQGVYAFVYNDANAICIYSLSPEEFAKAIQDSKESGEYWGAHLGWKGSEILDDEDYDEYRYVDNWELNKLYLRPTLEFCEETFNAEDWLDTGDVTVEYVLAE